MPAIPTFGDEKKTGINSRLDPFILSFNVLIY